MGRKGTCKQPTSGAKVSSVRPVGSSESALASAGQSQVVSIAISFSGGEDDFMQYHGGVFDGKCGGEVGGHAVGVVGVQSDYFIVRNSWGSGWGAGGYVYMKRGENLCDLTQHSTVASAH